jgi:hypothetical protein
MVLGWSPFNIMSDSPALHSKWLLLLKIEISLVVNFCFITNQNELCDIFSASLFRLGILWDKNYIKIFCSEMWVEIIFGGPLSELCVTLPFSINFRCQIGKQVRITGTWKPLVLIDFRIVPTVCCHLFFICFLYHGTPLRVLLWQKSSRFNHLRIIRKYEICFNLQMNLFSQKEIFQAILCKLFIFCIISMLLQ